MINMMSIIMIVKVKVKKDHLIKYKCHKNIKYQHVKIIIQIIILI